MKSCKEFYPLNQERPTFPIPWGLISSVAQFLRAYVPKKAYTHEGFCSRSMLREQISFVCTSDFVGTLHPREQNFHPAKCSTIFNRLNIWEQAPGANWAPSCVLTGSKWAWSMLQEQNPSCVSALKFTFANKIEAMYERSHVSVKEEPRSTSRLISTALYILPLCYLRD